MGKLTYIFIAALAGFQLLSFQNCSDVKFTKPVPNGNPESPSGCSFPGAQIQTNPASGYAINQNIQFSVNVSYEAISWVFYRDNNNNGLIDGGEEISPQLPDAQPVRNFNSYGVYIAKATLRKNTDGAGGFLCSRDFTKTVAILDPSTLNSCTTPWGAGVAHNQTFQAFRSANATCTTACESQQFRCNNGAIESVSGNFLIANYQHQNCAPANPSSCTTPTTGCVHPFISGQTVSIGSSVRFAKPNSQCGGYLCDSIDRVCQSNGQFGGDTSYSQNPATCSVSAACPSMDCDNFTFPVTVELKAIINHTTLASISNGVRTYANKTALLNAAGSFYSNIAYTYPGGQTTTGLYPWGVYVYRGSSPFSATEQCYVHMGFGPADYYQGN